MSERTYERTFAQCTTLLSVEGIFQTITKVLIYTTKKINTRFVILDPDNPSVNPYKQRYFL
jgi:hypothetical protein